jgi:SAM-dependent methyltransferase
MNVDTSIQDNDYIRKRVSPRPGDADYLHLTDLLAGMKPFADEKAVSILDYGAGGSPYRSLFPNSDYRRADFVEMSYLDYVIGDDSRVSEADAVFDIVLSTQVAEHVSHPAGYFAECFRLLKPGGRLICTTHGTYPDHGCPYDFQRWTADGLRRDLIAAGFSVLEIKKLTTNARALMYFMQRFSGWFDTETKGFWAAWLRVYRSLLHRRPRLVHRLADKLFSNNCVVDSAEPGHEFYVGVMAIAERP